MDHIAEPGKYVEALQAENAQLRAKYEAEFEFRRRVSGALAASVLQIRDMQEIVDAAMNENMPRIRAATKVYQDRLRSLKRKDLCPGCDSAAHPGECETR